MDDDLIMVLAITSLCVCLIGYEHVPDAPDKP